ncbi:MAG TPA: murein biosynthesis integral membrane protein MurJ [Chloroflexota bacterium]|nr:murein biosynthesis integral membrane protein MurJ [Chloroflexota bacterium]
MQTAPVTPRSHQGSNAANATHRRVASAAAIIALGNILSRGLGLVRDVVIASTFGATAGTDAYVLARTLPTILYDLLVGTVSTAAFVPVFVQHTRDERQLWRLVAAIFSLAGLAFVTLAVVLAAFADPLVGVIGSGFSSPDQRALAANLMRIALVSVVFQGLAGVLTSALYAQNRFTLPAFATATYNVGIIVGIFLLARPLGVTALAVGLVLGALAQFLLQASGLRQFWRAYRPGIDLSDPAVRRILTLGGTVAAGLIVTAAGQFIDRNLASRLPEGSLTSMEYATRVIQFPLGIVGLAVSFAILPTLSRFSDVAESSLADYRAVLVFGLKLVLLLMLPAFAALAALSQPLVAVLFERNAFQSADTARTAAIFLFYSPTLPLTAVDYLLINAFYARQNARTPVVVGVVCVFIYLAVALASIGTLQAGGLALANAVQNSSHALILLFLLGRSLPGLRLGSALLPFLARVIPAAALVGVVLVLAWPILAQLGGLVGLLVAALLATVLYVGVLLALGVTEVRAILTLVQARLTRRA